MENTIEAKPKSGPRDFFVYVLVFATMYASVISLIGLWWQYINHSFPDPLSYVSPGFEALRVPMAALIVLAPVFLFLSRLINREIAENPIRKELRIYRWLVYLTLFASSVTVIIDLISLIYNFLGGDLTGRFLLKVIVVLIVALGVFWYNLWHLRADLGQAKSKRKTLFWGAAAIIAGSIIAGFFIVGFPSGQRAMRFDQQRVGDLQTLQWAVVNYWENNRTLPNILDAVRDDVNGVYIPIDPRNGNAYEYHVLGDLKFSLCATFELPGTSSDTYAPYYNTSIVVGPGLNGSWDHDAGYFCFERTIEPNLHPQQPAPSK